MKKRILTTIIFSCIFLQSEKGFSQNMTFDWLTSEGSSGDDQARRVAIDADNNRYVFGEYYGSSFVVGGNLLPFQGGKDVCLIKYDSSGNFQWVRPAGSVGFDIATAIVIDNAGNI